jgi:hypothetical protein
MEAYRRGASPASTLPIIILDNIEYFFENENRMLLRRLIKAFTILAVLVVFGITALLALLWREHGIAIALPAPTGHFAVGRTSYWWVNGAQVDDLAPSSGVKREVVVWIWYPSAGSEPVAPAEYLPFPWHEPRARSAGVLLSDFLTRDPTGNTQCGRPVRQI